MLPKSKICECGQPTRFDSYQWDGHGYAANVCINPDCDLAWQPQDQRVVVLSAS